MKAQHNRITIVNKNEVKITRHASAWVTTLRVAHEGQLQIAQDFATGGAFGTYDDAGLEALQLAIACYRQTGDFTALSTDNATPFVGKRVWYGGCERTVVSMRDDWEVGVSFSNGVSFLCVDKLLPLDPPAKKYRATLAGGIRLSG